MISKLIRESIGDILDLISELAPWRNQLVEIYDKYSHPFSFINKYLVDFPTSDRSWAGALYRTARYFARQEDVLSKQGYYTELDPRLAGQIKLPAEKPGMAYGYRYNIEISVKSVDGSQSHTFNFWLDSTGLLSEADAIEMALPALLRLLDKYKLTFDPNQPNTAYITTTAIQSFVQYIPELNVG